MTTARAADLFREGVDAVKREDWKTAESKFLAAFELNPSVRIALNLGQVRARLGKYVEAAEHLDFAVRNWPVDDSRDPRDRAKDRLTVVKKEIGTLTITVSQPGATVLVDGKPAGPAPLSGDVYVSPGAVVVRAVLDGYAPVEQKLQIEKGKAYSVQLALQKQAGAPKVGASTPVASGTADEADLHFQIAADAYRKGDYSTALEHFLTSNRLVPNKNVVFNAARTYEQLKRYSEAYRYYLDSLKGETDPRTVADIFEAIKRITPYVAVLHVETDPPGATIYLERKDLGPRGTTPASIAAPEGKYRVIVELPGHQTATLDDVDVRTGTEKHTSFKLERVLGTVQLGVEGAESAEVRVDDEQAPAECSAPCTASLSPGRHTLYFVRSGFQTVQRDVNVVANGSVRAAAVLQPLVGSLVVRADERDAIVEIDGRPAGFTPAVVPAVSVGRRKVRVTLRGYAPVEREVEIQADKQSQLLDVKLVPLREVAAASRLTESVQDAPSSVTLIETPELRALGYPTIAEAMRGVRGVAISNDHTYVSASIRGLGEPNDFGVRLLVLNDGAVLNDNLLNSSYIGSDGRVDLLDVERVEVVRGPGSLLYGTGAMSGVVNLVPKPRDEPNSVHAAAGTYDNAVIHGRVGAHYNFLSGGRAGIRVSVSGARSDGFDATVESRDAAGAEPLTAHKTELFRAGGTSGRFWYKSLVGQWFFHSRELHIPIGSFGTRFGDIRTYYLDQRALGELRFEPQLTDSLQLFSRVHVNHYHYEGNYEYDPAPSQSREKYYGSWLGAEVRLAYTPWKTLRLTVGGEAQAHVEATMLGRSDGESYMDVHSPFQFGAVYVLGDWVISPRVRFSGGGRLDVYAEPIGPQPVGRGALIIKPVEGGALKLIGGSAFRAPSIYEQRYNDGGVGQVPAVDAVHSLGAETIVTGEIEYSQRFAEDWTATAGAHVSHLRGIINSIRVDRVTNEPSATSSTVRYVNSPVPAMTIGGEVEISRDFRQGWMLRASYGYLHAQYVDVPSTDAVLAKNPRLVNAPEHFASFMGVAPIIPDLVSLGARVNLEAPRRASLTRDATTPTALTADLTISGKVRSLGLEYVFGVYNIADQRYDLPVTESYVGKFSRQNGRTLLANVIVTYP